VLHCACVGFEWMRRAREVLGSWEGGEQLDQERDVDAFVGFVWGLGMNLFYCTSANSDRMSSAFGGTPLTGKHIAVVSIRYLRLLRTSISNTTH
jgi:hypothetical protein